MKPTKIITAQQLEFLRLFSQNTDLKKKFYLSGGTALAGFYLPYRYSEDLDFFSEDEVEVEDLSVFMKSIQEKFKFLTMDINSSFNRNLFFLKFPSNILKLEFTYYPFPRVGELDKFMEMAVDSVLDIAVNKLFAIYQKPRSRDFIDLYMINKKYKFKVEDLVMKAKLKFDWHVDWLQLGSQFLLAKEVADYPRLIEKLDPEVWQRYFLKEAKLLGNRVLKGI